MKKIEIVNLIKAHEEKDEELFKSIANNIANEFFVNNEKVLANLIVSMIYPNNFATQEKSIESSFLIKDKNKANKIYLPKLVQEEIEGIFNAFKRNIGINKFLFYGKPGSGKTEASRYIASTLNKELWVVSISELIDSKLGSTSKNIKELFNDINSYPNKNNMVVLFDEIDALSLNREDNRDIREMSRATTELFNGLDNLNKDVLLIATTNLYKDFDKALLRRFNKCINFDKYLDEDLIEIGMIYFRYYISKVNDISSNIKLFKKILRIYSPLPYPGELKNIISSAIGFSNPSYEYDYLAKLILGLDKTKKPLDIKHLKSLGFTIREIALILNSSKSMVGRLLNNEKI